MKSINIKVYKNTWIHQEFKDKKKKYIKKRTIPKEFLKVQSSINFELSTLLFHIADVTKNPFDSGISLNSNWAFLRYNNCFDSSNTIKLRKEYEDVDAHQKTILSDDLGMGFASLFLDETLKIKAITDTSFFLKYLPSLKQSKKTKKGPAKSPDFIVLDENKNLHLLECKGTQHSVSSSEKQLKRGMDQVSSIDDPNDIIDQRLVIGTYIANYSSKNISQINVIDPEFDYSFKNTSKEDIFNLSIYFQLLKELSFIISDEMISEFKNQKLDFKNQANSVNQIKELILNIKNEYKDGKLESRFENKDFIVKKTIDLDTILELLNSSKNLNDFIENSFENSKEISKVMYKGLFGLEMTIIKK